MPFLNSGKITFPPPKQQSTKQKSTRNKNTKHFTMEIEAFGCYCCCQKFKINCF